MTASLFLGHNQIDVLVQQLKGDSWQVVGPRLEQGTVLYRELDNAGQLPWGVHDLQQPGSYRVEHTDVQRVFAWANGPQALKPLLFAPSEPLWQVVRTDQGLSFEAVAAQARPTAIFGVRACDLAALRLQDKHFLQQSEKDSHYAQRRERVFLIAVNCSHPSANCFCASTGDGPAASEGYDLLLDELNEGFAVVAGSTQGETFLKKLSLPEASELQRQKIDAQRKAAAQQERSLPSGELQGRLNSQADSPRWQAIAERCLSCGNCTAVCPSCFCHSEHDEPQLDGQQSTHVRQWDSCFSADHSLLHGHPVREDTAHRYRQWLTHKFDHWFEQYGRSGCVGCGRCITWCPVGIDVVEELHHLSGGEA